MVGQGVQLLAHGPGIAQVDLFGHGHDRMAAGPARQVRCQVMDSPAAPAPGYVAAFRMVALRLPDRGWCQVRCRKMPAAPDGGLGRVSSSMEAARPWT